MSSVSQCHHVSGLYVFMNMALFNPVFTFSPLSIIQYFYYRLNMSGAEYSGWLCPLCLAVCSGLWQREFSKESTDHRTFLGKKYTKVMMMHRAGKKKTHSGALLSCQQINAARSNLSAEMAWTSVRSNLPPSYLSLCTFWFIYHAFHILCIVLKQQGGMLFCYDCS